MRQDPFGFLFAAGLILGMSSLVSAGPLAGIARTDGQPLETGPFGSHPTVAGPEITNEFQLLYLTPQPNTWTKTFRWEIPANTGLVPGATLSIRESIPFIYPDNSALTDPSVELPIADWHETMIGGDLSDFLQWDSQNPNTRISARIDSDEFPIHAQVNFSSDGKTIWFDFDPIRIPIQGEMSSTPVTLDIVKYARWIGPVLDPLPTSHHIDFLVSEYPTTPEIGGDYNHNGTVDLADYAVWRKGLGTTYTQNDYNLWRAHFGQSGGSGSGTSMNAAVPEPATLVLLLLAAAGVPTRRRWCEWRVSPSD